MKKAIEAFLRVLTVVAGDEGMYKGRSGQK
jgi:hypothetical protein